MNEPEDFDYRNLSDDLRDFIEVAIILVIAFAIFSSVYAFADDGGIQSPQTRFTIPTTDAPVVDVSAARILQSDGGTVYVQGGAWLNDDVLLARANQLVATQAELDALKATPPKPTTAALVITNILTGIVQTIGGVMTACYVGTGNVICLKR